MLRILLTPGQPAQEVQGGGRELPGIIVWVFKRKLVEKEGKAENKRDMLMRRACARTCSPGSSLLLEHSFQPTLSPLCGPASWPLLGACSMYPGEQFSTLDLFTKYRKHLEMASV